MKKNASIVCSQSSDSRQPWSEQFLRHLDRYHPTLEEPEEHRRTRVLAGMFLVLACAGGFMLPTIFLLVPVIAAPALTLCIGLLVGLISLRWSWGRRYSGIATNCFLVLMLNKVALQRGALLSTTAIWFPVCVFIAGVSLSYRATLAFAFVWASSTIFQLNMTDRASWDSEILGSPTAYTVTRVLACLVALGLVTVFEFSRQASYNSLLQREGDVVAQQASLLKARDQSNASNQSMRNVLDNTGQGFFTLDADAVIGWERSAILTKWFGAIEPQQTFGDLLRRIDENAAEWFEMGWEQLGSNLIPAEVVLNQLPQQAVSELFRFGISYRMISSEAQPHSVLVILTDNSELIAAERTEQRQRDQLALFTHWTKDRRGVKLFAQEGERLVGEIVQAAADCPPLRALHTFKGTLGMYGLSELVEKVHDLEARAIEEGQLETAESQALEQAWQVVAEQISEWLGERRKVLEISLDEYQEMKQAVKARSEHRELSLMLERWSQEDVHTQMERLKNQAQQLAAKLGKGNLQVLIQANGLRLEPERWQPFWSSVIQVVRNAVDHGIETAAVRLAAGKPERSTLSILTERYHQGLLLRIQDDGGGIDYQLLREKAQKLGLPVNDESDLSQLLFAEGLSSCDVASEVSGRGIGMAAVKEATDLLGGTIHVDTVPGQSTTFEFRFPNVG